jgi:hypothetical protein
MFDSVVTALMCAVLDEICGDVPRYATGNKALVTSKILESASKETGYDCRPAEPS